MKVFICSGGLDSSTLVLGKGNKKEDTLVFFKYGQKHLEREEQAFDSLFKDWKTVKVDLTPVFETQTNCSLITGVIPEGRYATDTITSLAVTNRNLMFILVASSIVGVTEVWYGAHSNDSCIYPDCTPEFVEAAQKILDVQLINVKIKAPFLALSKADIVRWGLVQEVDVKLMGKTYSCYNGREKHCGVCPTCIDRKHAFNDDSLFTVEDPTPYEV